MMPSALLLFVLTVGVACAATKGTDKPVSEDARQWIDLNTEATKHSIDRWTAFFSDQYVKNHQFKFGDDPPKFEKDSESWGNCFLNCDSVCLKTKGTLLPANITTSINVVEQSLYEHSDMTPEPKDVTRQLSKITYSSVTDGWTASASLGTGHNDPILVSASVSRSQSFTAGQKTSESTTSYTKCRPYHACYVKALTAYLTLNGTCEYEYEKECKDGGTVIEDQRACWEFPWYEFRCTLYDTIHDRYCVRNKERLPCSVTIPVMNGDKPWTHEISTTAWVTPWARGFDREGLCILDPTAWLYNVTSENYVIDGIEREPVEVGFPKPVDLAKCQKPSSG